MARVTKTAWFGPKRVAGWGWSPRSWQGWASSGLFLVALILALEFMTGAGRVVSAVALLAAFALLMLITADPPGGPESS